MKKYQVYINGKPYTRPTTLDVAGLVLTFLQEETNDKCEIVEVEVSDDT